MTTDKSDRSRESAGGPLIYRGHVVDKGTAEQGSETGEGGAVTTSVNRVLCLQLSIYPKV